MSALFISYGSGVVEGGGQGPYQIYCGGFSHFFADSHPEHQAVTLVLIIASLYDLNWMQQKIINAIKDRYTLIKQSFLDKIL